LERDLEFSEVMLPVVNAHFCQIEFEREKTIFDLFPLPRQSPLKSVRLSELYYEEGSGEPVVEEISPLSDLENEMV
jgi:hypothetical protein